MDTSRAKNIILVLLVVFNLFLLWRNVSNTAGEGISRNAVANMKKILSDRNVKLGKGVDIPRNNNDSPRLIFGYDSLDDGYIDEMAGKLLGSRYIRKESSDSRVILEKEKKQLVIQGKEDFTYIDENPDKPLNITDRDKIEEYIWEFLKKCGFNSNRFIRDGEPVVNSGNVTYTYIEKYKGSFVFENYIKITVSGMGVIDLEARNRKLQGFTLENLNNILTSYQILFDNFKENKETVITAMDFGYKLPSDSDLSNLKVIDQQPCWRVSVKGSDKPRYFGAFDGKEIY